MKKIKALLLATCIFLSACSTAEPENADTEQNVNTVALNYEITYTATVDCLPIDKTLDCEKMLLERVDTLNRMIYDYLNTDESKLVFSLGERCTKEGVFDSYKVISDDIKSYDDFKGLFSHMIHEQYIDYVNYYTPRLCDIDGELYFQECLSSYIGSLESWYLGYEVTDYSIVGHFARLNGLPQDVEANALNSAEYLNDEQNYEFYDITIHNINGEYLLTDCYTLPRAPYTSYNSPDPDGHGLFYNNGKADRSLITNEKVKPKFG